MLLVGCRTEFHELFRTLPNGETLAPVAASVDEALRLARRREFKVILVDKANVPNADFVCGLLSKEALGKPVVLEVGSASAGQPTQDERFTAFMNYLPGQAFIKDAQGRYVYVNQSFLDAFQCQPSDVIGKTDAEILPADLIDACAASDRATLVNSVHQATETYDVGARTVHMLVTKFRLGSGDMIGGIAVDITQQKEAEDELARAKDAAVAANRSKSTFVTQMSHELRTPLSAILGFADILDMPQIGPAERSQYLEIIRRNGRELARLVDDILDLAKVEANRLELRLQQTPIDDMLKDVAASLGQMARKKNLHFELNRSDDAAPFILTDPVRLRQILINVVGNAIKFTDHGSVIVTVRAGDPDDRPGAVKVVVSDTGSGLSPELQARLFQPFSQGSGTVRGTGLGLALSRHLARALGGDLVLAATAPQQGSTFVLSIAPGDADRTVGPSVAVDDAAMLPDVCTADALNGLRVLVVDDSRENQMLVCRMLKMAGAEVDSAGDGQASIALATSREFDVILMDVQMPIMSGYDATRELRRRGYDRPIVALTAHAMHEERVKCLAAGCDKHLPKPITRAALVAALAPYHGASHGTRTPTMPLEAQRFL